VLEIGCGLGTDLVKFARCGARVTGVDLSARSVELVQQRLVLEGLEGDVRVADAAALPFSDRSFDVVYSWGVLHHTPDTVRAASELFRVLRPGGRFCVMLYARRSWFSFGVWIRYGLLRAQPWRSSRALLAEHLESVGTQAFTRRQVAEMLAPHSTALEVTQVVTPYDRRVAGPLARVSPHWLGWFLVASGRR
jgi:ubiquinone/menaquinone biosynthesis C-methylase UbiE